MSLHGHRIVAHSCVKGGLFAQICVVFVFSNANAEIRQHTINCVDYCINRNWQSVVLQGHVYSKPGVGKRVYYDYAHNATNEIESVESDIDAVVYDANGNVVERLLGSGDRMIYTYDAWNRLVEVETDPGSGGSNVTQATFGYNALHWQARVTHGDSSADGETLRYYNGAWQLLWEVYDPGSTGLPAWVAVNVWGKRGANDIVMRRVTDRSDPQDPDAADWFYVLDHLFSVRAIVTQAGLVWERYSYTAYGEKDSPRATVDWNGDGVVDNGDMSGPGGFVPAYLAADPAADVNYDGVLDNGDISAFVALFSSYAGDLGPRNPFGYAGYVEQPEIGESVGWLARNRYLDPELGRWLTRDPAGYVDGLSLYLYVSGNPMMLIDPTGLFWKRVKNPFNDAKTIVRAAIIDPGAVAGAAASGAGEGVQIAANTYTFGAIDSLGITDTSQMNESYHDASRVAVTISRDAAIAAVGAGAAQAAANGGRAANVVSKGVEAYDTVQDGRDIATATAAAASGDPTAIIAVAGGRAVGSRLPNKVRTDDELIQEIATRSAARTTRRNPGASPGQHGTAAHKNAERMLVKHQRMYGDRGLATEISYRDGSEVNYGYKGPSRLDVAKIEDGRVTKIYDYKFGNSGLSESRINKCVIKFAAQMFQ